MAESAPNADRTPLNGGDLDELTALREAIRRGAGAAYSRHRASLTPRFWRIKLDIATGYLALGLSMAGISWADDWLAPPISIVIGSIVIGLCIAYLQLFLHEAAHYNLAAERKVNDAMADWLVSWQVGTSIADYRRTHSEHHRYLGETGDTEISYRNRLTLRFCCEMLCGIHALRVYLNRNSRQHSEKKDMAPLVRGLAIHALLLTCLIAFGAWPVALAWCAGIGGIYPILATLRQLLEHRPTFADGKTGAVTRNFGDSLFAKIFGGAGFNRHLLHHLEPQISYTRLADYEDYLRTLGHGPWLDGRTTSYSTCFLRLIGDARRD